MCRPSTLIFHIRVDDRHMPAVVTIRLYGYIDTYTINKGKRDKIIIQLSYRK